MSLLLYLCALALAAPEPTADSTRRAVTVVEEEAQVDALLDQGRSGLALARARSVLEQDRSRADSWYLFARASRFEASTRPLLREALRLDRRHARARMGLGFQGESDGELHIAEAWYLEAVAADPGVAEAWVGLARTRRARGDRAGATAAAREGAALGHVPSRLLLAELSPEEAVETLEEGLEAHPDEPDLLAARAALHLRAGEIPVGVETAARALVSDPAHPAARRVHRAGRCMAAGTLDTEGFGFLERARSELFRRPVYAPSFVTSLVVVYPRCASSWMLEASTLHLQGYRARAVLALRRAVDLDLTDPTLRAALGAALFHAGKPLEARELLRIASTSLPGDPSLAVASGLATFAAGDVAAALEQLEATWREFPYRAEPALALASVLESQGLPDAALEILLETSRRVPTLGEVQQEVVRLAEVVGRKLEEPESGVPESVSVASESTIVVIGSSDTERLRSELEQRFQEIGYQPGKRRESYTVYRSSGPILPWVKVYDDGRVDMQQAGLIRTKEMAPQADGNPAIPLISKRKLAPRREAVLDQISPQLRAWRESIAADATEERAREQLPSQLIALWESGTPLDGSTGVLLGFPERRRALLQYWASRTCSDAGDRIRNEVRRFLQYEVQASGYPVTPEELQAANAACTCSATLRLE